MTIEFPPVYLRHRLLEERELAKTAACEVAREAHAKLAYLYEAQLSSGNYLQYDAPDIVYGLARKDAVADLRPTASL